MKIQMTYKMGGQPVPISLYQTKDVLEQSTAYAWLCLIFMRSLAQLNNVHAHTADQPLRYEYMNVGPI